MNHRYTLPVTLALALHASLLAYRPSLIPKTLLMVAKSEKPAPAIEVVPLEEPVVTSDDRPVEKGNPTRDVATLPDIDMIPSDDSPLVIEIDKTPPSFSTNLVIDAGPIGIPDGGLGARGVVVKAGLLDNSPRVRLQVPPEYPFAAKHNGLNGEVDVEFLVDETGKVSDPVIVRSSDHVFDEPSLRAVLKWRFEPGRRDGKLVRFRMTVPVVFRLNDD